VELRTLSDDLRRQRGRFASGPSPADHGRLIAARPPGTLPGPVMPPDQEHAGDGTSVPTAPRAT
jgi:hypothetical protein